MQFAFVFRHRALKLCFLDTTQKKQYCSSRNLIMQQSKESRGKKGQGLNKFRDENSLQIQNTQSDTDKFVFNKGVNFLSILYKTIAIKNFIFESKIFTYEQGTVQNLHKKNGKTGFLSLSFFPKRQIKRCNSLLDVDKNTDQHSVLHTKKEKRCKCTGNSPCTRLCSNQCQFVHSKPSFRQGLRKEGPQLRLPLKI